MDLRQIRCFVALVEEGSVTGAARRLNVVQPAVSMSLRKLEDEFGVVLFDRTARGVVISQKARGLYDICVQILDQVAEAAEVLRREDIEAPTALTIGSLPSGEYSLLPVALSAVADAFPRCRIISRHSFNEELLDQISQGLLDIAIVSEIKKRERLPHDYLGSERLLFVGAPGSGLERLESISAALVCDYRLVLSPMLRRRFEDDFARAGIKLAGALEVDAANSIFGMLRQPGWFSILPASAFCGIPEGEFEVTPISEPAIERDRWLVWSGNRPLSKAAILFGDVVRRLLAANVNCTVPDADAPVIPEDPAASA